MSSIFDISEGTSLYEEVYKVFNEIVKYKESQIAESLTPLNRDVLINPSFVEYHGEKMFSKAIRDDETKTYKEGAEEYESVTGKVIPDMQTRPFTSTDDAGTRAANAI